ncbi:ParB N-terminal domain-containing protein [Pengzhenrongella sicca]|uniref:ParB N-terminal domain-containing protein n=1 Tax=Pengzhenrongella sicca TaxID=2819238 RepID=A0A8A4ZB17_9MICO|nr:ParB N-terminal domain-containing protein [Pengzhenrongella sicca]QTE28615.1 ParB N-terminal domain-containing protein [Pengzhenrongella sicca]
MSDPGGFLQLDQSVDSIAVGARHRKDLGDLTALTRSIQERGLLQPITITPEGVLVCGLRRLEVIKQLGWRTTNVWVRRISDGAHRMLAEQDENAIRKPFTALEAEELYREIKALLAEDAARRLAMTQFGSQPGAGSTAGETAGKHGSPESGEPWTRPGEAGKQAALMVTGTASHTRMEQIGQIRDLADDPAQPRRVRDVAQAALESIRDGNPVNPAYHSVQEALGRKVAAPERPRPSDADLDALAEAALERLRAPRPKTRRGSSPPAAATGFTASRRMWVITFHDLDGWLGGYDPADLATSVTAPEWAAFERVLAQMSAFAQAGRAARDVLRATAQAG